MYQLAENASDSKNSSNTTSFCGSNLYTKEPGIEVLVAKRNPLWATKVHFTLQVAHCLSPYPLLSTLGATAATSVFLHFAAGIFLYAECVPQLQDGINHNRSLMANLQVTVCSICTHLKLNSRVVIQINNIMWIFILLVLYPAPLHGQNPAQASSQLSIKQPISKQSLEPVFCGIRDINKTNKYIQ